MNNNKNNKNKKPDEIFGLADAFGEIDEKYISDALDFGNLHNKFMNKKKIFAVLIAAALLVSALSVSAFAAVFALSDEETAEKIIIAAENYIVMNAKVTEKEDLGTAVLSDIGYDGSFGESEAEFGFSGLRPVYNVSIKLGGFSYRLVMDAVTKKVLSCERTADENREEHLNGAAEDPENPPFEISIKADPDVTVGDLTPQEAEDILADYLYNDGCDFGDRSSEIKINYATNPATVYVKMGHAGYIYHALIDSVSREIVGFAAEEMTDDSTLKSENFDEDYHLHIHVDDREFISAAEAGKIAAEAVGIDPYGGEFTIDCTMTKVPIGESGITAINGVSASELSLEGVCGYFSCMIYSGSSLDYMVFIDAKTGEVKSAFVSMGGRDKWERVGG